MRDPEHIPFAQCKHRTLYKLKSRNLRIGIFDEKTGGFVGIRTKWGQRFLDSENHWDAPEFATARPLKMLGELPAEIPLDIENSDLFAWLDAQEKANA